MTEAETNILHHVKTERGPIKAMQIVTDFACLHSAHPSGIKAYGLVEVESTLLSLLKAGRVTRRGESWEYVPERPAVVEKQSVMF